VSYKERRDKLARTLVEKYQFPFDLYYDDCVSFVKEGFDAGRADTLKLADEILVEALGHSVAAMTYAYEDHADWYYSNVKADIEIALAQWQKAKEE